MNTRYWGKYSLLEIREACAKILIMLKFYLKLAFRVVFRANYYVTEDKVLLFSCHFLLFLNSFIQLDHAPFSPDLDMNDFAYFLEFNKLSKSGVYKAEDISKGLLWTLMLVSKEKQQKYWEWLQSWSKCTVFPYDYAERRNT